MKLKIYHDGHNNIISELTIAQLNKCSPNELSTRAVLSNTHIVQCVIRQFQLDSHTTGYSLLENYNNSVEKVLTLMTLYLKIVLNTDVFQHAILSSCWKFWRV